MFFGTKFQIYSMKSQVAIHSCLKSTPQPIFLYIRMHRIEALANANLPGGFVTTKGEYLIFAGCDALS